MRKVSPHHTYPVFIGIISISSFLLTLGSCSEAPPSFFPEIFLGPNNCTEFPEKEEIKIFN